MMPNALYLHHHCIDALSDAFHASNEYSFCNIYRPPLRTISMPNPVKTAQHAKGLPSFGATAKALLQAHPANDWGMKPRSLETQIGKLNKGEITWWNNHVEVAEALGELLDLSLTDLGLHGKAAANSAFSFSEFPGLNPLDLRREKPWKIGEAQADKKPREDSYGKPTLDEWLNPEPTQWRPPYEHHWLCVAEALEKRLLTQRLATTSPYRVVFTQTLEAASAELENVKPLICNRPAKSSCRGESGYGWFETGVYVGGAQAGRQR